jgi:hypothetical protein
MLTYRVLPTNLFSLPDQEVKRQLSGLQYTEVIRSLILYEVNAIRAGEVREVRTLRGLWYKLVKPIISRAGRLNELGKNNKPVEWARYLSDYLNELVDAGITSYEELAIIDGSRERRPAAQVAAQLIDVTMIGGHYPWIILFTEKDTIWPIVENIASLYGVSAISGKGKPSNACSENITRAIINSEAFQAAQPEALILLSLTDYDPSGYIISSAQLDQITTAARNYGGELGKLRQVIHKRIGITPDQLTPAELAANSYEPKEAGLTEWLKETGGINGQPLGLELDSLETSRIRAMYASAIEAEIDLTNRYNDLREAFIDLMACNALLPEFNRRRAELIAQARKSPIYTDIKSAALSEDLFYNAAIAGKPWVGPNETLQLFEAYQGPLTQLWH